MTITTYASGATVAAGRKSVGVFRAITIASGLELWAKHRMKPSRAYTPKNMMRVASEITGQTFKARDYTGAATAVRDWIKAQKS